MSKLERLFVQIFDRRNWIVDQLKSQEESYDQSLASCLLINGIEPPPWLLSAGFRPQNASLIELKKELTTETLLPQNHTQFDKYAEYMQTNLELDESLLRIQRSRSRQKDLELRSSAKCGRTKPADEEDAGDEYVCRVNRSGNLPSPKTNFVILAKQLDLDDTEDCSSSNGFEAALEKEKVDPFAEKRAIAQPEAAHLSKRKSILDGFRERSGPDAEQMKLAEAVIQPVDVPNKVEIAVVDSVEGQSEKQLDIITDTSLKNNISKSCGDAVDENCSMGKNMSKMITTEACAHLSATFSDGIPKVSKMKNFTADNISALPELGGKDGQKIIQTAENNFLDPVLNHLVGKNNNETDATAADKVLETSVVSEIFMDKVVGEVSSCTPDEKINVELTSMLPSDSGFVGDATNGFAKSRSFHLIESSSSLELRVPKRIEVEGKEICLIPPNSREKKNTRTLTQGSSEKCDQRKEPRYFLRSSTGHKKISDSLKLNNSSIFSEKSDMAEDVTDACVNAVRLSGTPCAAEVCYGPMEKDVTDVCVSAVGLSGTPRATEFFCEPMAKDVTDACTSAVRLSGTSCAAEVCCGPKESSELVDGYVDHYQSPGEFHTSIGSKRPSVNAFEQVNQRFGPNCHHTSVESLKGSTSAGKQVVTSCFDICNEQLDVPCNLRYSMSQDKNVGLPQSSVSVCLRNSLQLPFNLANACEVSWPMNKRGKVKNCSNCVFHTSPRIGRKNLLMQISKEKFVDHLSLLDSPVDVAEPHNCSISQEMDVGNLNVGSTSIGFEINPSMLPSKQKGSDAMTKLRSSIFLGVEKGGLNIEGIVNQGCILDTMEKMEIEEMVEKQQEDAGLHDCLKETVEVVGSSCCCKEMMRRPSSASAEALDQRQLSLRGEGKKEEKLQSAKNPAFSYYSASAAYAGDLETGQDETIPELEGFCMSVSPVCELPLVTGDGNGIDNLDLSCIKEDLPVFEQVYKSTSLPVSVSCPSVLDSMMDIKYSLPAELFQQMNLKHFIPRNGIDEKQFLASEDNFPPDIGSRSCVEYGGCLLGKSYSFTPPVGKLTSKSSLRKNSSLNKELTCFRIDEDSCINEESEIHEVVGPSEDVMRSRDISTLHKGGVLADVTKKYNDPISLASDTGKLRVLSSLASVNTDFHLERTQSVDSGRENGGWILENKNDEEENCGDSMYGCCARNTSESLRNRPDRQQFSGKVSEAKGGQSFIDKASKRKNLVSNISSFLPLVQQKPQQPAILTGKRDIKVKALEAAEAAKRLEIERENARKIRKEAAKLEREKLEKENIRQLELKQKKREEERKKKEADIAARKRQREEEERKGKERKRRCVEEVRKQQQEREEKLRVEKEEKEMRRKAAQEERKRKALSAEARQQHKMEKAKEGNGNKARTEQEKRTTKIMSGASKICENGILAEKSNSSEKVVNDLDSFKLVGDEFPMTEASLEPQSYEISPYQPSDEEEEEEEEGEALVKKFIPEWAREKSIARSLDFLQHVNPDDIFLPERCFNINESKSLDLS